MRDSAPAFVCLEHCAGVLTGCQDSSDTERHEYGIVHMKTDIL